MAQSTALPPVTPSMVVVGGITLGAFLLFVSEVVRTDVTALLVMVTLMLLEPWTRITPAEGISGFSNEATIIVLAMFVLSAGVRRTGAIQKLSEWMASIGGDDEFRQLAVTVGIGGVPSGFLNNTPVVAMLIPAVTEMARKGGTSVSKLLIPLSYASILGGTLTLVGTTSNLIASDVSSRLLGRRISMFEFTHLGILVFLTGVAYLLLVGRHLIPERLPADGDRLSEYGMAQYLTAVIVDEGSPFVGLSIPAVEERIGSGVTVLGIVRGGTRIADSRVELRDGDTLVLRADVETIRGLSTTAGLSVTSGRDVSPADLEAEDSQNRTRGRHLLAEVIVPSTSKYVDRALVNTPLHGAYDATVLAIRRSGDVLHHRLDETELQGGDTLLVQVEAASAQALAEDPEFVLVRDVSGADYRTEKISLAVGIVAGVVGLAAAGVLDLLVAALGGVVAMVLSGVLTPDELYEAIDWEIIFLLAGIIPLGIAFEKTGAANFLGALVALSAEFLPPLAVLWTFYLMTLLLTALISNVASVVLMIPVAVETAVRVGADPFVFVLAVMFASSADFMTPIGYQTNLLVYGPGGYRFTDYFRVGAPLELLLSVVTVVGLDTFWGI